MSPRKDGPETNPSGSAFNVDPAKESAQPVQRQPTTTQVASEGQVDEVPDPKEIVIQNAESDTGVDLNAITDPVSQASQSFGTVGVATGAFDVRTVEGYGSYEGRLGASPVQRDLWDLAERLTTSANRLDILARALDAVKGTNAHGDLVKCVEAEARRFLHLGVAVDDYLGMAKPSEAEATAAVTDKPGKAARRESPFDRRPTGRR